MTARPSRQDPAPVERGLAPVPAAPPKEKAKIGSPLIEFSSEAREDPNDGIEFGDAPVHCSCPHCDRAVCTFIDYEASWVTYLLAFVVWFSLGWMAFWVLPLLWPAFKDAVHHCPRCLNVIARKSRISLPTFRTEVMTLKIGSCAVVLARKYVVILVGLLGVIGTVYVLRSTVHLNAPAPGEIMPKGHPSSLTWDDFVRECGPRTSLRQRTSTVRSFDEHFRKRTFKWQGEVFLIREGFDVLFLRAKSVVMLRMHPQRFPRRDMPDVALLFGEERNAEVAQLNPGDWVEFEATMTAHGHRGDPEVMMLWHIAPVPRPSPLSSSAVRASVPLANEEARVGTGKAAGALASAYAEAAHTSATNEPAEVGGEAKAAEAAGAGAPGAKAEELGGARAATANAVEASGSGSVRSDAGGDAVAPLQALLEDAASTPEAAARQAAAPEAAATPEGDKEAAAAQSVAAEGDQGAASAKAEVLEGSNPAVETLPPSAASNDGGSVGGVADTVA